MIRLECLSLAFIALHDKLDRIRVGHLEGLPQDQTQRVEELDKLIRASSLQPFPS
jgi:hypothetical protein